jgi:glycosyltransferase involved in cell wall biosynthesis
VAESFSDVDEVWATSNWVYDIYKKNNVSENIYTYQHGLSNKYERKRNIHYKNKPFTFLHIGEPDKRKGGRLVVECFTELFGDDPNYELIIKSYKKIDMPIEHHTFFGFMGNPDIIYDNIKVLDDVVSLEQLLLLFEFSNVFVYPSAGEGFGYTPLEAICSGIPTICIPDWADYSDYITVPLKATLSVSLEPDWHPGQTYLAEKEHLKELMLKARDEHEKWSEIAFNNASLAYEEFKWETTTKPIIERLKNIQISRNL